MWKKELPDFGHNTICEELFGRFDGTSRIRPSATILTNEAHMFTKNHNIEWLKSRPEQEQAQLLNSSWKLANN